MKWTKPISEIFLWKFPNFYYTSNFLRILIFLLHLKQLSCKTNHYERSENLPFSRNLVRAERKRIAQGGAMWTEDNKKSDASHMAWINLIQSNTAHCAKWGLVRAMQSTRVTCGLFCRWDSHIRGWEPQETLWRAQGKKMQECMGRNTLLARSEEHTSELQSR